MAEEVGTQTEAEDGNIVLIDDGAQSVHLGFGEELALVGDDHVDVGVVGLIAGQQIGVTADGLANRLQADAGTDDGGTVTGVQGGLDEPNAHAAFLVIELGNECLGGLGGPHCTVFEVKLGHA